MIVERPFSCCVFVTHLAYSSLKNSGKTLGKKGLSRDKMVLGCHCRFTRSDAGTEGIVLDVYT